MIDKYGNALNVGDIVAFTWLHTDNNGCVRPMIDIAPIEEICDALLLVSLDVTNLNIDEIGYTNWFADNEVILVKRKEKEVEV